MIDMSLSSMADDLVRLLKTIFPVREEAPAIVLVGHSMVSSRPGWGLVRVLLLLRSRRVFLPVGWRRGVRSL